MNTLSQIQAIVLNEFRSQWRRRGMLVLTLGMMALPVAGAFLLRSSLLTISTDWVASGAMSPEETRHLIAQTIVPTIWAPLYVVLALILPIITADAVPRDRQAGSASAWGELLDSFPLPTGAYLLGKLLGVWASILVSCLAAMLLTGVTWWFLLGPYDLLLYVQSWVFGAAALGILNGGLSLLLAAAQPSPRRAAAVGVVVAVASLFSLTLTPILTKKIPINFWDHFNIARPTLFLYFFKFSQRAGSASFGATVSQQDVLYTLLAGLLEIVLCGLAMWAWMRRRKA